MVGLNPHPSKHSLQSSSFIHYAMTPKNLIIVHLHRVHNPLRKKFWPTLSSFLFQKSFVKKIMSCGLKMNFVSGIIFA